MDKRYINEEPHLCLEFTPEEQSKFNIIFSNLLDYIIDHEEDATRRLIQAFESIVIRMLKENSKSEEDS